MSDNAVNQILSGIDLNALAARLGASPAAVEQAVEVAVPGVDLTFYRLTYQNQHYFSLTKDLVLMVNAELGYADG